MPKAMVFRNGLWGWWSQEGGALINGISLVSLWKRADRGSRPFPHVRLRGKELRRKWTVSSDTHPARDFPAPRTVRNTFWLFYKLPSLRRSATAARMASSTLQHAFKLPCVLAVWELVSFQHWKKLSVVWMYPVVHLWRTPCLLRACGACEESQAKHWFWQCKH